MKNRNQPDTSVADYETLTASLSKQEPIAESIEADKVEVESWLQFPNHDELKHNILHHQNKTLAEKKRIIINT